jgi:hypothetical protein
MSYDGVLIVVAIGAGVVFTLSTAMATVLVITRMGLLRDVSKDYESEKRLTECEAAINLLADKVAQVMRDEASSKDEDRPTLHVGSKDPESYTAAAGDP